MRKKNAKTCNNLQKFAKTQKKYAKMRKIVQKLKKKKRQNCAELRKSLQNISCKIKKLAQLEKNCTDGVTRVTLFSYLCPLPPSTCIVICLIVEK